MHKITEFYTEKERELLGDLMLLKADIERIEDEDANFSTAGQSVDSDDEEDEEMSEEEDGVAKRTSRIVKGALETIFSHPSNYDAATRAGRKAKGRAISGSRSFAESGSISEGRRVRPTRPRATSTVSQRSDLLGLSEEDRLGIPGKNPQSPSKFNSAQRKKGPIRRSSRMGLSTASGHYEEEVEGVGIWGSNSDWAIDTKIMYKRRVTAVFTVSLLSSFSPGDADCDWQALSELKQYVDLNYTGLRKILKKYVAPLLYSSSNTDDAGAPDTTRSPTPVSETST